MAKRIQPNEIKMAQKLYESGIRGINEELRRNLGVSKNRAKNIMERAKVANSSINDVDTGEIGTIFDNYRSSATHKNSKMIIENIKQIERNYKMAYWNRMRIWIAYGMIIGLLLIEFVL